MGGEARVQGQDLPDAHRWTSCRCLNEDGSEGSFPPPGWTVQDVRGGANHTVALLQRTSRDSVDTQVWVSGDGSQGQYGTPSWVNTTSSASATAFRRLAIDDLLSSGVEGPQRHPSRIAATWGNTFVVLSSRDSSADDILVCLGGEGDFGQLGLPQASVQQKDRPNGPHIVPLSISNELRARAWQQASGSKTVSQPSHRSPLKILAISAGVRHVVALASWQEQSAQDDSTPGPHLAALFGWGAARHGQLDPSSNVATSDEAAKQKRDKVHWEPRVLKAWLVAEEEQQGASSRSRPRLPILAPGRDHTAVLVPSGWEPIRGADDSDGAGSLPQFVAFGSNKAGQLDVAAAAGATTRFEWAGSTWNSTFALEADEHEGRPHRCLLASGKNDKGQLGCGAAEPDSSRTVEEVKLPLLSSGSEEQGDVDIVCGSEHVLALVKGKDGRGDEVWGWGWNEHGNLALDPGEEDDEDGLGELHSPTRVWPPAEGADANVVEVRQAWAGCATSFLSVVVVAGCS